MLQRFAAASAVGSAAIGIVGLLLLLAPLPGERFFPVMRIWVFLPAAWGLWAMLTPRGWLPQRLPWWGAILGVVAGGLAAFALNLPSRIAQQEVPASYRVWVLPVAGAVYYLLWMLVRRAYSALVARH